MTAPDLPGPGGEAPLPLVLVGQDVLHRPAEPVTTFDDALARLVDAMFETMYAAPGIGLAAPQVGVGLRVFVYDLGGEHRGHVVNPVLERTSPLLQDEPEGCLSVPGLEYPTPRARSCRVDGVDVHGRSVHVEGQGLLARCLQHEVDHLDGMLYLDRLGGRTLKTARREMSEAPWHGEALRHLTHRQTHTQTDAPPDPDTDIAPPHAYSPVLQERVAPASASPQDAGGG